MSTRDLLANTTPRPWRVGPILARAYEGTHEIVGADDSTLAVTGGENDPLLLVKAVNEYEDHLALEAFARGYEITWRQVDEALARLDAIRASQ